MRPAPCSGRSAPLLCPPELKALKEGILCEEDGGGDRFCVTILFGVTENWVGPNTLASRRISKYRQAVIGILPKSIDRCA